MHGGRGVGVEVEGDSDRAVTEHLRDELGMDARAEHKRRCGVVRVMRSDHTTGTPARSRSLCQRVYTRGTARVRPSGRAKTRPSRLTTVESVRWRRKASTASDGSSTTRRLRCVFGSPRRGSALVTPSRSRARLVSRTELAVTVRRPASRSTSRQRSASSSPWRNPVVSISVQSARSGSVSIAARTARAWSGVSAVTSRRRSWGRSTPSAGLTASWCHWTGRRGLWLTRGGRCRCTALAWPQRTR